MLADPSVCTDHFSEERWRDFRRDLRFFRNRIAIWDQIMFDWGYNATPVWAIAGRTLANTGRATERQVIALALIDTWLALITWVCVAWAFGWRTLCVALLFWGTSVPTDYGWTGGSLLRNGWLATSVVGVCLLRRGRPFGGGFLLGYATLLRVFPGLALAGIGVKGLLEMARARRFRLAPDQRRAALGALLAFGVLLSLAAALGGGPRAWLGFVRNSIVDSAYPSFNDMGLKGVFSFQPGNRWVELQAIGPDAPEVWTSMRMGVFRERWPLYVLVALLALVPLILAADRQEDWVAAVLGMSAMVILFQLSSYYYAALVLFALLWHRHASVGVALVCLAALSRGLDRWFDTDDLFISISAASVLFVLYCAGVLIASRLREAR